uniref:riboflavin kinase n=1 Tax=Chenopodium quinoa TaxID=63459 RepID=A0A803LPM1_CHEQI
MTTANPAKKLVSSVILDLDGTLLNTGEDRPKFHATVVVPLRTMILMRVVERVFKGQRAGEERESERLRCLAMVMADTEERGERDVILNEKHSALLCQDGVVIDVLKSFLIKYGKEWDGREVLRIAGKTPLEASAAVVEAYNLPCKREEFEKELPQCSLTSNETLIYLSNIKPLPGANRLINHLHGHGIPIALASNSPRTSIEKKLSYPHGWKESFSVVIGGDEVKAGKPSPNLFLEAAKRLNVQPFSCLVIEDSIPGVTGGKAAGMEVIAVPSQPKQSHLYTMADEVINSLFDLRPEQWSLPPFQDWIDGTLPIEPWHIGVLSLRDLVVGQRYLASPQTYSNVLSEYPSGVYLGWAGVSKRGIYKMVMSIGWNPYFNNPEKTIEPWLLHEFEDDFYGEELRLVVVGYIYDL